jgi:hypothetical protein
VYGAGQFRDQGSIYAALAFHPAHTVKGGRHKPDMEMGFALAAIVAGRPAMAGMFGAFVAHFQGLRRKSCGQFVMNGIGNAHGAKHRFRAPKVKRYLFLFFTASFPYLHDG